MKQYDLDKAVRKVPDFPKEGVLFYDITGILTDPEAFGYCVDRMVSLYKGKGIDAVAAIEARGFLFAAPFAVQLGIPLILVRKKGKLPGKTLTKNYNLEYGEASIQIHVDDVKPGANILLVDDLIATGGTLSAARSLLEDAGGKVHHVFGVIGLPFLSYEKMLQGLEVTTLLNYHAE
ncbi:MAG TPA: adenine phosphoribosyltransferase [Spirochaetia bacterium]|nr:adenine phosphoribosyltransferase [Spirochaetia bacterium]